MTDLSKTQQTVLEQAAAAPENCIRNFMGKMPLAAQKKVIDALLKKGLVKRKAQFHPSEPNGKEVLYLITEAGCTAIGKEQPAPAEKPAEEKPRITKQDTMLTMLKEGTTLKALMQATGWQKHSVHGAMANLKKKQSLTFIATKEGGEDRVYKIA